jgi:hypothetical protein
VCQLRPGPAAGADLAVEGPHDGGGGVDVPDLERRLLVAAGVGEEAVHGGPPRELGAQHAAVGEHQLAQNTRVVTACTEQHTGWGGGDPGANNGRGGRACSSKRRAKTRGLHCS